MLNFNLYKDIGSINLIALSYKIMNKTVIIKPQKIGFKILSSIFKLNKSMIKKTKAPLSAIIIIFKGTIYGSNNQRANKLTPKEAKNPEI